MIRDLQMNSEAVIRCKGSVLVIGAGIAGLLLASRLARLNIQVLVLESGAEHSSGTEIDNLNVVENVGQRYRGATEGRSRGLGGTSRLWGGAMLPFHACDMETHTAGWGGDWPVSYGEVEVGFKEIERIFDLPTGSYEVPGSGDVSEATFLLRSAKWPLFARRNLAKVLKDEIEGFDIYVNSTVTDFDLAENGRIESVTARCINGNCIIFEGDNFVVAAGAIESTRLLLLLDHQHGDRVFAPDGQLGQTFCDHLSAVAATITPLNLKQLNLHFGITFERGGMRDLRVEPSPVLRRKHGLPGAFAHVVANGFGSDGFSSLRDIYRAAQKGSGIPLQKVWGIGSDLPWLARAALWRFHHGRLLYPRDPRIELVLVTEQFPNPRSTIKLCYTKHDFFGLPLAQIDWQTSVADFKAFATLQNLLCAYWNSSEFASHALIAATPPEAWEGTLNSDASVFHPSGTTRMGRSVSSGVVDADLRSFRVPNLTVVSTSCFPTGGSANPTFMLMAFALRAADKICAQMRQSSTTHVADDPPPLSTGNGF